MTGNGNKLEHVQELRDGIALSDLLFGEHAGGQAIVRAFESQIVELLDKMLQAESVDELAATQNQAVGILRGLEKMGGNIQRVRTMAAEKAGKRTVRQALNLHETLE